MTAIILVSSPFTFLFMFCNFGQKLTNQFDLFEYEMYKCKWYLLPIGMQHFFAFATLNAQQLATVNGFGNIELSRETSKEVNKRMTIDYSYQNLATILKLCMCCSALTG